MPTLLLKLQGRLYKHEFFTLINETQASLKNMEMQMSQLSQALAEEELLDNTKSIFIDQVQASLLDSGQHELWNEEVMFQEEECHERGVETKLEGIK